MKNKIKIVEIGFYICLVLYGIFIGAPINENTHILNSILNLISIGLLLINLWDTKKMKFNLMDLLIVLLVVSSFIPVVAKTYYSYYEAQNHIFKYVSVFCIYFITRSLIFRQGKKVIKNIINLLLISSVILMIIGILDMFPSNSYFTNFMNSINAIQINDTEVRMDSIFGYANTLAIFLSINLFFSISIFLKEKNIKRLFYIGISFILLTGILLTASRLVMMLVMFFLLLYFILLKGKENKIDYFLNILVVGILAIIYNQLYFNLLLNGQYGVIFILLLLLMLVCCGISNIIKKYENKIYNIQNKYLIFGMLFFILISIVYVIISLNISDNLVLFSGKSSNKEYNKVLYNLEGNQQYNFKFKIETTTNTENIDNFKIVIVEKNKYFDDIKETSISFNNYKGEKSVSVVTDSETEQIYIKFCANIINDNTKLVIYEAELNGENLILNYKYIPTVIAEKIQNINLKTKSAWERIAFIKDGIEIIKNNIYTGIGGGCWKYCYQEVQEYRYSAKEVHSYPIQIFLEFGIVAIISYIGIILLMIRYSYLYIKKDRKDKLFLGISIGFFLLTIHSFIDFNLSFNYILLVYYILVAIMTPCKENRITKQKENRIRKLFSSSTILFLILFLFLNLSYGIGNKIGKQEIQGNYDKKIQVLESSLMLSPYSTERRLEKIRLEELSLKNNKAMNNELIKDLEFIIRNEPKQNNMEIYGKLIQCLDNNEDKDKIKKVLDKFVIELDRQNQIVHYSPQYYINKIKILEEMIRNISKYEEDTEFEIIKEQLIEKVKTNKEKEINIIKDYKKCRYPKEEVMRQINYYNKGYQKIITNGEKRRR